MICFNRIEGWNVQALWHSKIQKTCSVQRSLKNGGRGSAEVTSVVDSNNEFKCKFVNLKKTKLICKRLFLFWSNIILSMTLNKII